MITKFNEHNTWDEEKQAYVGPSSGTMFSFIKGKKYVGYFDFDIDDRPKLSFGFENAFSSNSFEFKATRFEKPLKDMIKYAMWYNKKWGTKYDKFVLHFEFGDKKDLERLSMFNKVIKDGEEYYVYNF